MLAALLAATAVGCSRSVAASGNKTPPSIAAVVVASVSATTAIITWTTDKAADSQVQYGTTSAYGQSSALNAALTIGHTITLSGLAASTTYHFRVRSKDAAGNVATSGDFTFTTSAAADTTPPVISQVSVGNITATAAVVIWITNEASDSQVEYGTTASYGLSSTIDARLTTTHSVQIFGLTASTLYHYRVRSKDAAGNPAASGDLTFSTLAVPDTAAPTVSLTSPADGAIVSGTVTITAQASDDVGVTGVVFLLDGAPLQAEFTAPPYSLAWDSTTVSDGPHALAARAHDAAGNQATSTAVTVGVSNHAVVNLELAPPVGGFTAPLDLQQPNDGTGRLFVVEQGGLIKVIQPVGGVSVFVDLSARPGFTSGGETGLLGLAFHPNYAVNGRFYVNYTRNSGTQLQTVIAEFTASPASANSANAASERILFTVDQPFANHNGGGLAFGPDGFLYIALGDGGSGGDPLCNAQNLGTLLGKILRIDVNGTAGGLQYRVPASNPFVATANARSEIWLYGLRNPFRFSFDRATGDMYIGDVGQGAFEEVDFLGPQQGGANLGWNLFEGSHPFSTACTQTGNTLTGPIFDYSHDTGDTVVTGGYVYRGAAIAALAGAYVFGDFGSGRVWTLTRNAQGQWVRSPNPVLLMGGGNLSSFGEAQNGDLYVVRYTTGEVARIREVGHPITAPAVRSRRSQDR